MERGAGPKARKYRKYRAYMLVYAWLEAILIIGLGRELCARSNTSTYHVGRRILLLPHNKKFAQHFGRIHSADKEHDQKRETER